MKNTRQELIKVASSKYIANVDFCQTYWQLPLRKDLQKTHSFISLDELFYTTRAMHRSRNTVFFQSTMPSRLTPSLADQIQLCLDDVLMHTETAKALLFIFDEFFTFCAEYRLNLHLAKCTLLTKSVRWCGRIIFC